MDLTDFEIRTVLLWDRFRESELTATQRIMIHQWLGQKIMPPPELKLKLKNIYKSIPSKWQPPVTKYNEERVLVFEDPETLTYKPVKP